LKNHLLQAQNLAEGLKKHFLPALNLDFGVTLPLCSMDIELQRHQFVPRKICIP
jgi:hypothetical protein